jgi:hypothetical protein
MLRSAAVALAALAALDTLMFGGTYTHVAKQMIDAVLQHVLR